MESDFRRIFAIAVKEKDKAGFTWNPAAVSATIQYILEQKHNSELKYENRKARMNRLIELKAPEFIIESEKALMTKAEVEIQVYKYLENYLMTADKAAGEEILWDPVVKEDVGRIEDAVKAAWNPRCRYCTNSILTESGWTCRERGIPIDIYESEPEEGCGFEVDDVSKTDYEKFLESHPVWYKEGSEEDRMEMALASHHAAMNKIELGRVLTEEERNELEEGMKG